MNAKIKKINAEYEKNAAKIAELQARQKELDKQRTELENLDIVGMVRSMGMTPEELAAREPSFIISRRPCALLKYVKHQAPLAVDTDKCVGCKSCMRIGCPAISMKEGKAHVDNTLCVGCGVCKGLCPKQAIG